MRSTRAGGLCALHRSNGHKLKAFVFATLVVALLALLHQAPAADAIVTHLNPSPISIPGHSASASATQSPPRPSGVVPRFTANQESSPLADTQGGVLVYKGNNSSPDQGGNSSYANLEEVTERSVESATTLPANLSGNSCVLLQLNSEAFDLGQISVLQTYMEQGGVVVGIGEYYGYDTAANENLNALASSLGVNLSFEENALDSGFHETTSMGDSPYSSGLSSLAYAAVAGVEIGGSAQEVASTESGIPFIGAQAVGGGAFALVGDSNVLSDFSGGGYAVNDNGVLASNLCGAGNGLSRSWPPGGLGYSFANRGMNEYAYDAGLRPSDVLLPARLATTFADWSYHPILSGILHGTIQEELEALTGFGILGRFWKSMEGGTCYGLALSGGRFADGAEALYAPDRSRTDSTWDVGSGQSASMLLPEPSEGESSLYNKQFLQLDTDDFLTQFSREVLGSFDAQRGAFADPTNGVAALRKQLESVMKDGDDLYGGLSGPAHTNLALISLMAHDSRRYGHEVLAYSFKTRAGGGLKIEVWDNNFPGDHYYIVVNPDGTWNYEDAPYQSHNGYRSFGTTYSLSGQAGYSKGYLYVLPPYKPEGLHLYPGSGTSIVDIGPRATASDALAANGSEPSAHLTISGSPEYEGESLVYNASKGSVDVGGAEPSIGVRGADTYMSLTSTGSVHVTEDAEKGSISGTGAPVDLAVARNELMVTSSGTSSLAMSQAGEVNATADSSGKAEVTMKFDENGSLGTATLFSGATTPGASLVFTPAEVAEAQLPKSAISGPPPPAPGTASAPVSSPPPRSSQKKTILRCRKGSKKRKVHGKPRCIRAKKGHRGHGKHPRH